MKLKIKVTRQHIKDGVGCESQGCAIALAAREVFPNAYIGNRTFHFGSPYYKWANLPKAASNFIDDFDGCHTIESRLQLPELTFEVDIPDSVIDRIDISAVERSETLELIG